MGLAEVLVAGAVGGVIIAGSMKSLSLSLQSAQVVRSSLSESDLRHSLRQTLGNSDDCSKNLEPTAETLPDPKAIGLYGIKREWGRGEVVQLVKNAGTSTTSDDILLLEKGVDFKGDLEIVKMELKGSTDETDPNNPRKNQITRTFVVYYSKVGMGSSSTLGGEACTASDLKGCYFSQCTVEYQLDDDADASTTPNTQVCNVVDCVNYGSGGSGGISPNCRKVNDGQTLVGCGGTNEITGSQNTAFGYQAGSANSEGQANTFIGNQAGKRNTKGYQNVFLGAWTGYENTEGNDNSFFGAGAGGKNTKGGQNTFFGSWTGYKNTEGNDNTFLGNGAGKENTTGSRNTFLGNQAGKKSTGHDNTFVGNQAGKDITSGASNTFIGKEAGKDITSGASNTFIGKEAGKDITSGDHNIILGAGVKAPSTTDNRQLNIGNMILGKQPSSTPTTWDSTVSSMTAGEVRVLGGPLKVCDNDGGNCKKSPLVPTSGACPSGQFLTGGVDSTSGEPLCGAPPTSSATPSRSDILSALSSLSCGSNRAIYRFTTTGVRCRSVGSSGSYASRNHNHKLDDLPTALRKISQHVGNWSAHHSHPYSVSVYGACTNKRGHRISNCFSSRVYKKNITPYSDLDKSLKQIVDTPLFTYQYKKDHPNKTRMGVISEELPNFLQIKDKGAPSRPDWVSIYGTLWAGIKALFQKQDKLKEQNTVLKKEIQQLKQIVEQQGKDIAQLKQKNSKLK